MFMHAPDDDTCIIRTMVLWNNPDLGLQAVRFLREIERRTEAIRFDIRELSSKHCERDQRGDLFQLACTSPLLIVALDMTTAPTEAQKSWFQDWADTRAKDQGALAVFRGPGHVAAEQFEELVHDHPQDILNLTKEEREFHDFLKSTCQRGECDFLWGAGEADLQEATEGLRYLPSSTPDQLG